MSRNFVKIFLQLTIIVLISSCAIIGQTSKSQQDSSNLPDAGTKEGKIIGLWEHIDSEGLYRSYEFLPQGEVIEDDEVIRGYEFASDKSIALKLYERQEIYKILGLVKITKNTLVLEDDGVQTTYKRAPSVDNLATKIIGLWEADNGIVSEFTKDGIYLDSRFEDGEPAYYSVLSNNTVSIYMDRQKSELFGLLGCLEASNRSLVMGRTGTEHKANLKKLPGFPDLASKIIGTWKNEDGEVALEFVETGKAIIYLEDKISSYEVISDNTIKIDKYYFNVVEISKTKMNLRVWNQGVFDDIFVLTKSK